MNKLLASSSDPKQLSLTIKGVLVLILPLAAVAMKAAGHQVDEELLKNGIDLLSDAIIAIGSAVSAVALVVGAVRKIVNSSK